MSKDKREEMFKQIDKEIEELSDEQKDFVTYVLLGRLIDHYKAEYEKVDDKNFKDALYKEHLRKCGVELEHVKAALGYQLW